MEVHLALSLLLLLLSLLVLMLFLLLRQLGGLLGLTFLDSRPACGGSMGCQRVG